MQYYYILNYIPLYMFIHIYIYIYIYIYIPSSYTASIIENPERTELIDKDTVDFPD